jgi:hypothetical protein
LFCPKCKAEYRESFLRCADCNVDLVPELPPEQEQHTKPEQYTEYEYINLVNIVTYPSRHEAELVKGLLSANGIDAVVKDGLEAAGGAAAIFELLVKENDVEETRNILCETDKIKEFKELEKSADRYMFKQLLGLVLVIAAFIIISRYGGKFHDFYTIILTGFLFAMLIHLLYKIYKKMRIKRS